MVNLIGRIFVVLVVILSIAQFALALETASIQNATFSIISTSKGNESATSTSAPDAGNITKLAVDITVNTKRWAGYVGNVTGSLQLANAVGDALFEFDSLSRTNFKGVFAAVAQSFNFATIQASQTGNFDGKWGFGPGEDNASQVFRETATRFDTAGVAIARMMTWNSSDASNQNQTRQNQTMDTALLVDAAGASHTDFAFGATVVSDSNGNQLRAYDNSSAVDFELIVALNDSDTDGDPDGDVTYYFYLQIK